ncbi:MAG: helix-turn-helix domain-containing protein [Bacteroidetes bacterium]|nr:helix-turn-helix domain-containing protein [Bacteroidota bacterium]
MTLLGMAYESGFNSKTVFNVFFKKKEGIIPGAWLKAAKK